MVKFKELVGERIMYENFINNYKFSRNNRKFLSLICFVLSLIILIKSLIIIRFTPFFILGGDIPRHIALIQRTILDAHIQYFHPDGSISAYLYYPPGLHILISELKLVIGWDLNDIVVFMAILVFLMMIFLTFLIAKEVAGEKVAILSLLISSIFLPILHPAPYVICLYIFFPLILLNWIRYINKNDLRILVILSILTVGVSIIHYSYFILFLFATLSVLISIFLSQKSAIESNLNVWLTFIYSIIIGFFMYSYLTPNLSTALRFYALSGLWSKDILLLNSLYSTLSLLIATIIGLPILLYLTLRKTLTKIKIKIQIPDKIIKITPHVFSIYQLFFLIALIIGIALSFIHPFLTMGFEPALPFFARKIAINSISDLCGMHKPAISTFFGISLPALYLFTVVLLKRKLNFDKNDTIFLSFIIIPLILIPLSIFDSSFITNSSFASRLPNYGIAVLILYSSFFIFSFLKSDKKNIKAFFIVILIMALVFSSTASVYYTNKATNEGYNWLIENTPIYVDEYAESTHYSKYLKLHYTAFSFDTKGYYHLSEFPISYKSNLFDMQIKLIQNERREYTPLLKIDEKNIILKNVRWKTFIPSGLAYKIYSNDKIAFYNLVDLERMEDIIR